MKFSSAIFGIGLSALLATSAGAAEEGSVYRWVDKDGTPHYQDRPPEGADPEAATAMNLRYKMTDAEALAAANKRQAETAGLAKLRETQQADDKKAEDGEREKVATEREQNCQTARDKAQKYETAHRLYKPGPDGNRTYLTDEEIDAARAKARQDVADWCGE